MSEYIKLSNRTEERLSGYGKTGTEFIFDTDKLQIFAKANGWSVYHTVEIANWLLDRIGKSSESVFEVY